MDDTSISFSRQPWGSAAGLVGGSVTVLGGILNGVGTYEIMIRTIVVFALTSLIVRVFIWILVAAGQTNGHKP